MIVGPPETPYQFAFFEFSVKFGIGKPDVLYGSSSNYVAVNLILGFQDYPAKPPTVQALTTNKGRCRFNPNIYASGRVCLSILGTWQSHPGEQWSSAQGLESTLLSIQSLMSNNPYKNEPGYETARSETDKQNMKDYVEKIQHESLRIAVIQPMETSLGISSALGGASYPNYDEDEVLPRGNTESTCESFIDLRKRRFLWYYESYMQTIDAEEPKNPPKRRFKKMPFEHSANAMNGHFDYPELRRRMIAIKEKILSETEEWPAEGLAARDQELGIAVNLRHQYEQISQDLKDQKNFGITLELANDNAFLWELTYFGRPMSHLDGGVFKFKIYLSPRFPDEQPRVFMDQPIFHVRVSKAGVLCYLPQRVDDMRNHIDAIVAAIDEESPPYDPRTNVNPEASILFWGTPEDRKKYYRNLRRSIEKTWE
ncbi:ubiquitin conjugating enzyme [Aspergillus terreus]|uniref:Ubiquitin-conjugating enzyme E2 Z n=1 Tax=Aspergillus terreus TaxID=33178 RepID=A0A5M3Z8K9_ASPTE|nr:hypothetical protein ATETN484_0011047700 [Aspergillus terreus]GFF19119.1 ubiquitin conjugating enzyme [Aspergillus terreus]